MILRESETVQITIRDVKDCFYLFEVPPSRVANQVIGLRIPRTWLEHLDDETWEVGFHEVSLKHVPPSNPSLN